MDAIALNHFLNFLLAESINNQDRKQSAQIREVQRCLALFDAKRFKFVFYNCIKPTQFDNFASKLAFERSSVF